MNSSSKHSPNEILQDSVSHNCSRVFKPEKLKKPRDFQLPKFVKASQISFNARSQSSISETKSSEVKPRSPSSKPLVVEIGAGKGKHACLYASQNPDHNIIAIERTTNKFASFSTTAQALESGTNESEGRCFNNLLPVHADAIPYCVFALAPMSVDTFFILYPNPEPKNPNQQWLNMPFFEFLLSRLKPNGKVVLASNRQDYIENAYEQANTTWKLITTRFEIPKTSARTHFEIKYLARNETCWEIQMTKPEHYITRFDDWVSEDLKELTL